MCSEISLVIWGGGEGRGRIGKVGLGFIRAYFDLVPEVLLGMQEGDEK